MAETLQDSENPQDMESRIKSALFSRSSYFAERADSLTLVEVRRLLEKDLGLETDALKSHRKFVKDWLYKCIEAANADSSSKHQEGDGGDDISTKQADQPDKKQAKKEEEDLNSKGDEDNKMDDSPVMGLMTGSKRVKTETDSSEATDSKGVLNESTIKKAVWARASYLKENSENVTLGSLRRLLEEDLKLEERSLDTFKKFIKDQVNEILQPPPESPPKAAVDKKKNIKKGTPKPKKEETPASSENESDEVQVEEVKKGRKRGPPKAKIEKSEASKRRKRGDEGNKGASGKQSKVSKSRSDGSDEEEDGGNNVSENENSDGSADQPVKQRKEVPKQTFGKQVEHLRSVIKSCGLSVPPSIYKKVKQAPENKREASLIKELEDILAKEGLSSNPSEKEIKDVKKRKERARELEGIDLSNIVSSSRRRSTSSFIPPPKPQIPDLSESESEESDNEDDDEEDVEVENEEGDEDQENGDDDNNSQSQESEADDGDSD